MIKTLTRIGNSLGLVIDKPILELLGIDADTPLTLRTDGRALIVERAPTDKRTRVRESTGRLMKAHAETLRKLAK